MTDNTRGVSINICDAHELIKQECERGCTQKQVAMTYALAIRSSESTDWSAANRAILDRWSPAGLERIKKMAWSGSCFEEKP